MNSRISVTCIRMYRICRLMGVCCGWNMCVTVFIKCGIMPHSSLNVNDGIDVRIAVQFDYQLMLSLSNRFEMQIVLVSR